MNPYVKTEGKYNESVSNEFKIMRKSNSLHQIITVSKSSHQGCSVKKGVLRNLGKFTGKHL